MFLEILSVMLFAGLIYMFLVVVPSAIEKFSSEEFKRAYFSHLGERSVHSYGK